MGTIEKTANLFRILGDAGRLSVLQSLRQGERNVSQLCEELGEDISVISHRLKILHQGNLVNRRREGSYIYYSLSDEHVSQLLLNAIDHSFESVEEGIQTHFHTEPERTRT